MLKLAVFDFDSTLMDGETIDFFADELGIGKEVADITEEAMSGRLDFFESLQKRVGLLKGLDYSVVQKISQNLPYMNGAKETISALKKRGMTVVCFSGGFRTATSYAKDILGYSPPKDVWDKKTSIASKIKPKQYIQMLNYYLSIELELKTNRHINTNLFTSAKLRQHSVLFC